MMAQLYFHGYMKHLFSTCILLSALVLMLPSGHLEARTAIHADKPLQCESHVLPVTLSALNPTVYHIASWLCYQGSLSQHHSVQVLVHGATYGHSYWDFTFQPDMYSYVKYMTNAGYATFNFDRIGIGVSDHPPAALVTIQSNA
jgi:hypothetical protein